MSYYFKAHTDAKAQYWFSLNKFRPHLSSDCNLSTAQRGVAKAKFLELTERLENDRVKV